MCVCVFDSPSAWGKVLVRSCSFCMAYLMMMMMMMMMMILIIIINNNVLIKMKIEYARVSRSGYLLHGLGHLMLTER